MGRLVIFLAGAVFAVGLSLSGMTQPQKVIGFLDFAGDWDPSLMFVMVGAIAVYAIALPLTLRRSAPVFAPAFRVPSRRDLTPELIGGATLFGMGWGLSGFCPGPALASAPTGASMVFVFLGAMVGGMLLWRLVDSLRSAPATNAEPASSPSPAVPANRISG